MVTQYGKLDCTSVGEGKQAVTWAWNCKYRPDHSFFFEKIAMNELQLETRLAEFDIVISENTSVRVAGTHSGVRTA